MCPTYGHSNGPPTFQKRVIGSYFCHFILSFHYVMKVEIYRELTVVGRLRPQNRGRPRATRGLVLCYWSYRPWKGYSHRFLGGIINQLNQTHCSLYPQIIYAWECSLRHSIPKTSKLALCVFGRMTSKLLDFFLSHYERDCFYSML